MTNYIPQAYDLVRATSGENVLIGEVSWVEMREGQPVWVHLVPDAMICEVSLSAGDWNFEQIMEPMNFKPLAVVELKRVSLDDAFDPKIYQRFANNAWAPFNNIAPRITDESVEKMIREGKAIQVFEGVEQA